MTDKTVVFKARLKAEADAKLRNRIYRRGELLSLVILILKTADLRNIPLIELGDDLRDLATTTVKLPAALHKKLKSIAEKRRSTMTVLLNSAVLAYEDDQSSEDES